MSFRRQSMVHPTVDPHILCSRVSSVLPCILCSRVFSCILVYSRVFLCILVYAPAYPLCVFRYLPCSSSSKTLHFYRAGWVWPGRALLQTLNWHRAEAATENCLK